jgi:predicted TIM-barrel fold metal-dependent hydrolase
MTALIALEEHYVSSAVIQAQKVDRYATFPPHIPLKLKSLDEGRLQDLDNGKVSLQVISHGPGVRPLALCSAANDELAFAISKHPTRMAGFAMLPMDDPAAAAKELERCVKDLHFVGALVDNHVNGDFYDNGRFWPIFEKAEELNVPMYIHPSFPADKMSDHYKGNYNDKIALALSAFGWGWHSESALSILKLFASGFFDRFQKVKIIIGHMGEMIPFQLDRIITISEKWGMKRGFGEVWKENIWVTTSGMFALPPLACLLQTTPISHVLYSVDYPFSSNEQGLAFFEKVQKSGLLSRDDLEKFAFRNAEVLLGVKAKSL